VDAEPAHRREVEVLHLVAAEERPVLRNTSNTLSRPGYWERYSAAMSFVRSADPYSDRSIAEYGTGSREPRALACSSTSEQNWMSSLGRYSVRSTM
jgi:hypothetical protein